jgi:hypothetical protein
VAGILDAKERIFDTIITPVGRAQIASGELKIEFASFTDRQMYYSTGSNGELDDPGKRIYFESYSTDSDLIVQELDADANIAPFQTDNFTLYGGTVISGSNSKKQTNVRIYADALAEDSINSLQRQMTLGTRNFLKNELVDNFNITPAEMTFYIDQIDSTSSTTIVTASLDDVESLWQDYRISSVPNYQYLPPKNMDGSVLGRYTKINQDPPASYEAILFNLAGQQKQKLTFSNTRTSNDILGQIFEIGEKKLSKLVIVDGGSYTSNGVSDPHVFYAGKLYRDTKGSLTFVNIFTLVFE